MSFTHNIPHDFTQESSYDQLCERVRKIRAPFLGISEICCVIVCIKIIYKFIPSQKLSKTNRWNPTKVSGWKLVTCKLACLIPHPKFTFHHILQPKTLTDHPPKQNGSHFI